MASPDSANTGSKPAAKAVAWHSLKPENVASLLNADANSGLSSEEARKRLEQFGPNLLKPEKPIKVLDIFREEVREPMILLLLVTGVLYGIWGEFSDSITILLVIIALVGVEVFNEFRAKKTISSLMKLSEPAATLRRGGKFEEVLVENIVPGDLIMLNAGRTAPADARLLESFSLSANESSLTGESAPVEKEADAVVPENAALAERKNMVFAGTSIGRGRGLAVVVSTGMNTELGRIAALAAWVKPPRTPLQTTMRELTRWMVWLALGFSTLVPLLGILLARQPIKQMLLTGLSLAFSTIPEELPIIITMVLAVGGYRLSRRRAVVKKLRAVETLGAVTVIATDKTGTLTENRMEALKFYPEELSRKLLETAALCNDVTDDSGKFSGDPLEVALLTAGRLAGLDVGKIRRENRLKDEFTFDNARKLMTVVYDRGSELYVATKGAPENVLAASSGQMTSQGRKPLGGPERKKILSQAEKMAGEGLRVIAFAEKILNDGRLTQTQAESNLNFIGLVGLADRPRAEVKGAIAACKKAGIRPVMITGDHPLTAASIASEIGLDHSAKLLTGPEIDKLSDQELQQSAEKISIYARTTPEHKLRIVQALRKNNERIAVTGDGINDAPALAAADIGVAMGETGTDVAREAADMVLVDDNFATIVAAVEEGRKLFANLRKGVRYYLACKLALIGTTLLPVLLRVPVPFAPVQIILMELFMDLAASAAFVAEKAESGLMNFPPRDPRQPFMSRSMAGSVFYSAFGLFAAVAFVYLFTWHSNSALAEAERLVRAQTIAFVSWLLGHLFLALNMRSEREPLFKLGLFSNRVMVGWAAAAIIFILAATLIPQAHIALKTVTPTAKEWGLAITATFAGAFWLELKKLILFQPGHAVQTPSSSQA